MDRGVNIYSELEEDVYSSFDLYRSLHGYRYQFEMLVFIILQALRQDYPDFQCASEMKSVEGFDDIVLKVKAKVDSEKLTLKLFQIKHILNCDSVKLCKNKLFCCEKKEPYALCKYLKAFVKICRQRFSDNEYVENVFLCVNGPLDSSVKDYFDEDKELDPLFRALHTITKCASFKLNQKGYSVLEEKLKLGEYAKRQFMTIDENITDPAEFIKIKGYDKDFMEKFRLIANLPEGKVLNTFGMPNDFEKLYSDWISSKMILAINDWLCQSKYKVIKKNSATDFIDDLKKQFKEMLFKELSMTFSEKLRNYEITFKEHEQTFLDTLNEYIKCDRNSFVQIITEHSSLMTCIEIDQWLRSESLDKDAIFLEKKDLDHVERFRQQVLSNYKIIIIYADYLENKHSILLNKISQLKFEKQKGCSLIVLSNRKSSDMLATHVPRNNGLPFQYLTHDSQKKLFEKTVNFRNKDVRLKKLISKETFEKVLDCRILNALLNHYKFSIGCGGTENVQEPVNYDFECTLSRELDSSQSLDHTDISEVKISDLQSFSGKVYILSGDPGIGKSHFLKKMFSYIKGNNPNVWVIKLQLTDIILSEDFKVIDSTDTSKLMKLMVDLVTGKQEKNYFENRLLTTILNGIPETCSYPSLVFLFDSFDEICPSYKEPILRLLTKLQTTNIFQMWIVSCLSFQEDLKYSLQCPLFSLNALSAKEALQFYDAQIGKRSSQYRLLRFFEENAIFRTPLHLKILAEIEQSNGSIDYENMFYTYGLFCNAKFELYIKDKRLLNSALDASKEIFQFTKDNLKKLHSKCAIKETNPELCSEMSIDHYPIRMGLIIKNQLNFTFGNKKLAEYFASLFIGENTSFFLNNYKLILSHSNFKFIRKLLNHNNKFLTTSSKNMSLEYRDCELIFGIVNDEENFDLLIFILNSIIDIEVVRQWYNFSENRRQYPRLTWRLLRFI